MHLTLDDSVLWVHLTRLERWLARAPARPIAVQIADIAFVSADRVQYTDPVVRGTRIAGVLMAGTFSADDGLEFRLVLRDRPALVLGLRRSPFVRICLSTWDYVRWQEILLDKNTP